MNIQVKLKSLCVLCNNQVILRQIFSMVSLTPSFYLLAPYQDQTAGLLEDRLIIMNTVEKAPYSYNMHVLCQGRNLNIWVGFFS